jgi:hypothetical protein
MKGRHGLGSGVAVAMLTVTLVTCSAWASDQGWVAVEQVSMDNYIDLMDNWLYTHDGDDRGYGPEHDLAMDNIVDLFESYGLSVELHPFSYSSSTYYNVVATQVGTVYPEQQFVIGAHYDSVSNPGADDNASGVALVLEAARVISQYASEYTIVYIAFDREEQGLVGSTAYAQDHQDDDIQAMISADMVAYNTSVEDARIYSHASSHPLRDALGVAIEEYGDGLSWFDAGWIGASNHAPFDALGFQAALLIEADVWENPHYHTQQDSFDTPGYLNFPFAIKMVRGIVGWLVDNAGVQVSALFIELPEGAPWRIDPEVPTDMLVEIKDGSETLMPESATMYYRYDEGDFLSVTMEPLGGDLYQATLPPASCDDSPQFYFAATGDEGTTIYKPEAAPAATYSAIVANLTTFLSDDCESDLGWTVENIDLADGGWGRGVPVNHDRHDPPTDYDGSGQCYLTDNDPVTDNSDVDGGPTRLISPLMDLSDTENPQLRFARWWANDDQDGDPFDMEVSNDGGTTWVLMERLTNIPEGWVQQTLNLADFVAPTAEIQVRFAAQDSPNNSIDEAGIDAIELFELTCDLSATGDHDGDEDVDLYDYNWLQICFSGEGFLHPEGMSCEVFDFNGDSDVDLDDYASWGGVFDGP